MTLNGQPLEVRRKTHNGKDLPTELTDLIVRGNNRLLITLHDAPNEKVTHRCLGVELIHTQRHSAIISAVWANGVIPAEKTLETIKTRLKPSSLDDVSDDEICIEASDLAIDLADPFSAKLFTTPARGANCQHLECFDLENWLNTRQPKLPPPRKCSHKNVHCDCPPPPPQPSHPDKWRCPICLGDARPGSLRIDGFLLEARKQLEREGKLTTKKMRVDADGKWKVEIEEEDEGSDGEGEVKKGAVNGIGKAPAAAATGTKRKEIEIIELD